MDARALKDKAAAFFTKGRFAKAAETYEEFCVLDKKDHQARLRCGDAWSKAGKKDRAILNYSQAAEGFAKDGFLPRAIAASKLVLEIDPAHKGVQKMLAELYAQKSGGPRPKPPPGPAGAPEMEVTRSVSAPVSSSFVNNKAAIDLDAPVAAKPKPTGYRPAPTEAPSPMNRADALELPEYEIPMGDGPSSVGGMNALTGHTPQRRNDAIELDVSGVGGAGPAKGPKALVEMSIDVDLSHGQPVTGEVEIPIEGQALPDADQLPPELQMAQPLAPAITFDLPPPPPAPQNFELKVEPPPPGSVYDLTDAVPDPKPSIPVFELTEVADAPAPAPAEARLPPAQIVEPLDAPLPPAQIVEPLDAPLPAAELVELEAPLPPAEIVELDAPLRPAAQLEPLDPPGRPAVREELDPPLRPAAVEPLEPLPAPEALEVHSRHARTATTYGSAPSRSGSLPPSVGDAASAPPSIKPIAAGESSQPPGLKPRKPEAAVATPPPGVPTSSPSSSRIWLPPTFTPAATRAEDGAQSRPVAASGGVVPPPAEPSTDLERSLQAFMQFDPDAPAPARQPEPARVAPSFTELDLDEGDSLLHAVEAAASLPKPAPAANNDEAVEEAMEAPEDPKSDPGGLPKIPLFSDLPEDAFIALFEKCPLQRFEEGQLVFEQGDKADAFYVICAGEVRVFRTDGDTRKDLAKLEEGSFFGEMALLSEAPRSASVEAASEDTQVLVISAEILKELSAEHPAVSTALKKFCRQRMLSNLMNQAAIFAPFNRNDRRDLVQKFRARDVKKGDVLVKEGTISDGLYVVLSGEVAVEMKGHRIATLKEGQVFGEMSLLTRSPAKASVRAMRHTSLLRLPKPDFDGLILSHPQVLEHVSSLIDERNRSDASRQQNDAGEIL